VPVVRQQLVGEHPEVRTALAALARKITEEDMRQMNYAVDGEHRDAAQVVARFLRDKGL